VKRKQRALIVVADQPSATWRLRDHRSWIVNARTTTVIGRILIMLMTRKALGHPAQCAAAIRAMGLITDDTPWAAVTPR
jgi:hypothetical protein